VSRQNGTLKILNDPSHEANRLFSNIDRSTYIALSSAVLNEPELEIG
jgi:hypothetical protein